MQMFKNWIEIKRDQFIPDVFIDEMREIFEKEALNITFNPKRTKNGKLQYDTTFCSLGRYCKNITWFMLQKF
jgi:uncharacterized protein YpmS